VREPLQSQKNLSAPDFRNGGAAGVFWAPGVLLPRRYMASLGPHHTARCCLSHRSSLMANPPRPGRLVLETLDPLPGDRKCFRMINGVLVERTVKDVVPALRTNAEGLKKVLDDLVKQYKVKQDELEKWKVWRARARGRERETPSDLPPPSPVPSYHRV